VRITIFDREGIKVYEMSAIEGWDGRDNGLSLPSGDYWFIIKYPSVEGKENQIGHFTLLR
jgi:gliding motility-associated-like protein